jgi:hypothetical protein
MGERPSRDFSIDRIDNSKGYSPENCRWATRDEQARNTRRVVLFEYNGQLKCLAEWCEVSGIPHATVRTRYRRGWTAYQSVWTPVGASKVIDDPEFKSLESKSAGGVL